ncbi:MAG: nucleotidyltransferase domain-containing protein [Bacilli bacterium]
MKEIQTELDEIVNAVLTQFDVYQIYLFGSYAKGTQTEESDLDLCIVVESTQRKIDLLKQVRRALYTVSSRPLDVLIYPSEEFEIRSNQTCTMEFQIVCEGVLLYEKATD